MSWKIRHQGSPRSIDNLQLPQVVEGLQDGLWEPTDEIMGPQDRQWVPIESHPQLAETVLEMELPMGSSENDETRLDMNPLIDVSLVLLVFFILTTSYAAIQKVLDMPNLTAKDVDKNIVKVTQARVKEFTIRVEARQENGQPVIRVEGKPVDEKDLVTALGQYVHSTHKTEVLIDLGKDVPYGTLITIQDAAKGAGIQQAHLLKK